MMFRGALARLAAQYFVLLVLILGCFDLIVYVTVSQALQAKADKDLQNAVTQAMSNVTVTGDTLSPAAQALNTPSPAEVFVRVEAGVACGNVFAAGLLLFCLCSPGQPVRVLAVALVAAALTP